VRVLPLDKYEMVMAKIRQSKTQRPAKPPAAHQHHRM
jgi:hypothetical protein